MKNNQPVTQQEYLFPDHYRLISSTDTDGVIQHCNEEFIEVSGFSKDELLQKNHNIIRHPDMPESVFHEMWKTLKSGKSWQGLVKNRRKNGDHYWVNAFVTPIFESNRVVGYESVRTKASPKLTQQATQIYLRLNRNLHPLSVMTRTKQMLQQIFPTLIMGILSSTVIAFVTNITASAIVATAFIITLCWQEALTRSRWRGILTFSPASYHNAIVAQTYHNDITHIAQVKLMISCELSRTKTALTRIQNALSGLETLSAKTHENSSKTSHLVDVQTEITHQIAQALTNMKAVIDTVATRVQGNTQSTALATENLQKGNEKSELSMQAIRELKEVVESISQTVTELAQSTDDIGEAANLISSIAEQTNLLALNAAIEAARAGEQGRGFAVVADEVRNLASKTRESTDRIHQIIEKLSERSERAVTVSAQGLSSAENGSHIVQETRSTLKEIHEAVIGIDNSTSAITVALKQQDEVFETLNQKLANIIEKASETKAVSDASLLSNDELKKTMEQVYSLAQRFNTDRQ